MRSPFAVWEVGAGPGGSSGLEFNLLIAASAMAVAIAGPGRVSLDAALGLSLSGALWGLAALAVGVGTAAAVLAQRVPAVGAGASAVQPEDERRAA